MKRWDIGRFSSPGVTINQDQNRNNVDQKEKTKEKRTIEEEIREVPLENESFFYNLGNSYHIHNKDPRINNKEFIRNKEEGKEKW